MLVVSPPRYCPLVIAAAPAAARPRHTELYWKWPWSTMMREGWRRTIAYIRLDAADQSLEEPPAFCAEVSLGRLRWKHAVAGRFCSARRHGQKVTLQDEQKGEWQRTLPWYTKVEMTRGVSYCTEAFCLSIPGFHHLWGLEIAYFSPILFFRFQLCSGWEVGPNFFPNLD